MNQPRRYKVRHLKDVEKLTEREIAERLQISQPTVNRDLAETVAPAGFTELGTPYYPPGRFDRDPEYQERVGQLAADMPKLLAREQAAREFAGGTTRTAERKPSTEKQIAVMEAFAKAHQ